jgi:hypothetical protein
MRRVAKVRMVNVSKNPADTVDPDLGWSPMMEGTMDLEDWDWSPPDLLESWDPVAQCQSGKFVYHHSGYG